MTLPLCCVNSIIGRRDFSPAGRVQGMLSNWLLVALGGATGAVIRFYISETLPTSSFPWATLSVNLVGSFLLGVVASAALTQVISEDQALLLGVGFLGAFTTMSTFSLETITLVEQGQGRIAGLYVLLNSLVGPVLAWMGWKGGQALLG